MPASSHLRNSLITVLVALAASACVDEKIVYQDRELFEELPAGAADFVGYTDGTAKLTVCGNCHVGPQSQWEETAHAHAWDGLQSSGGAQSFCEGCHSVSDLGNAVEGVVGYDATQDERYHDVQCESCHGPGLAHIEEPGASQPYAALNVGADGLSNCGECHTGTHHPFAEEWASSGHADTDNSGIGRSACQSCHEARAVFAAWGVDAEYVDKDDPELIPIVCGVCHDPHGSQNSAQLRFPIDVASEEQNLCMKCHHKRGEPDPTSSRGPHSPQGPLLLGEDAGWRPPNFTSTEAITGTHGSEANPRLCAGCHVSQFTVNDPASGDFLFHATGHVFKGTPCVDANGVPTGEDDCDNGQRSFAACAVSGCHGSEGGARAAMVAVRARFDLLSSTIDELVAQVPASEFVTGDNLITTGEGAKFNSGLAKQPGTGAHNPFLVEALLIASIRQLETDYGLRPPVGLNMNMTTTPPPTF